MAVIQSLKILMSGPFPIVLKIKVIPKAKIEKIKEEIRADDSVIYKIYVTAAPEDGKANEAVIKFLSKVFGLSKSSFKIIHGHTTREKAILIDSK